VNEAAATNEPHGDKPDVGKVQAVEGPVARPWREGALTRAHELHALSVWALADRCTPKGTSENHQVLVDAIWFHLQAARDAAKGIKPPPVQGKRSIWFRMFHWFYWFRNASLIERATSNIDAAEALLLNLAPPSYLLGQMPSLLNHVQRNLPSTDPRRQEFERIAQSVGVKDPNHPLVDKGREPSSTVHAELILLERIARKLRVEGGRSHQPLDYPKRPTQAEEAEKVIEQERGKIVTIVRSKLGRTPRSTSSAQLPQHSDCYDSEFGSAGSSCGHLRLELPDQGSTMLSACFGVGRERGRLPNRIFNASAGQPASRSGI